MFFEVTVEIARGFISMAGTVLIRATSQFMLTYCHASML
jgi:hypothetical protein